MLFNFVFGTILRVSLASAASSNARECESLLAGLRGIAEGEAFEREANFEQLRSSLVEAGFEPAFVENALNALMRVSDRVAVRIYDMRDPAYVSLAAKARGRILQESTHTLFPSSVPGIESVYIASLDPSKLQHDHDFEEAVMEVLLHLKQRWRVLQRLKERNERDLPYIYTWPLIGWTNLIHRFFIKEIIAQRSSRREADRAGILYELENSTLEEADFKMLMTSLVACARQKGTTWDKLSVYAYARCLIGIKNAHQFRALEESVK